MYTAGGTNRQAHRTRPPAATAVVLPTLNQVDALRQAARNPAARAYAVEVLGGESIQAGGWEPTLEFVFESKAAPEFTADVNATFTLVAQEY